MAFSSRMRVVCGRAHERLMSASRNVVLAVASLASALVVAARVYGVLSSRHEVTVVDAATARKDVRSLNR